MRLTLLSHVHTSQRQKGPNTHGQGSFSPITTSIDTSFPRDNLSGAAKTVSLPSPPPHHHTRTTIIARSFTDQTAPHRQRREPRPVRQRPRDRSTALQHPFPSLPTTPSPSDAITKRVPPCRGTSASLVCITGRLCLLLSLARKQLWPVTYYYPLAPPSRCRVPPLSPFCESLIDFELWSVSEARPYRTIAYNISFLCGHALGPNYLPRLERIPGSFLRLYAPLCSPLSLLLRLSADPEDRLFFVPSGCCPMILRVVRSQSTTRLAFP